MRVLSIDIGFKNLGYCIFDFNTSEDDDDLEFLFQIPILFNIFVIDDKHSSLDIVSYRNSKIIEFFESMPVCDEIIIERQVPKNTIAMELMYAIDNCALMKYILWHEVERKEAVKHVHIFDPKIKFTFYKEPYDTKFKAHKKKSIKFAENFLSQHEDKKLLTSFKVFSKKDDISDAINQGLTWFISNKKYAWRELMLEIHQL